MDCDAINKDTGLLKIVEHSMVVRYKPENKIKFVEIISSGNTVKWLVGFAIFSGITMLCVMITDLRNIHEKALQISHESRSLHQNIKGSVDQLDKTSRTLKLSSINRKNQMYRIEPTDVKDEEIGNFLTVVKSLGFDGWDGVDGSWSLLWSIGYPSEAVSSFALNSNQLINHIPGIKAAFSKKSLISDKNKFVPTSFLLPDDKVVFLKYASKHVTTWICKDANGLEKPKLNEDFAEVNVDENEVIMQEYIKNAPLVDRHKFDIQVFVLVTSISPLRVYIYRKEWIVRYSTIDRVGPANLQDAERFLIQKDNFFTTSDMPSLKPLFQKYKLNHKESLLCYLEEMNLLQSSDALEQMIDLAISETMKKKQADIFSTADKYKGHSRNFFELLRFNFVFDNYMKPYLVDVDTTPDISSTLKPQFTDIFEQLIYDTLSLVGITNQPTNHREKSEKTTNMLVNTRDIQIFPSQCTTPDCNACSAEICQLCAQCMPNGLETDLKDAYNEHENRRNFRRVLPEPLHAKGSARDASATNDPTLPVKDYLLDLWFRGKCLQDETWCS